MTTFADFLIEFGPRRRKKPLSLQFRAEPWAEAAGSFGDCRLLLSAGPSPRLGFDQCETQDWMAWTIGEVNGYDGRPGGSGQSVRKFLEDHERGTGRPESLCGRFLILAWQARNREWNVWTDRMGSVQAYAARTSGGAMALGTYSPAVYAYSQRKLDWAGLASFFSLGFFIEDRTHYEDCRILRPACHYRYAPDGRQTGQTAYWRWHHTPDTKRSEADTIAEFGERFARVVELQTSDSRVALPLSGGLDSRTVAACLPAGHQVTSYSYGYTDDSVETSISRQVAAAAGLPFHAHTIRPYLFDKLELVLQSVEGFQDVTQSRQADIAEWLAENSSAVIGAHWGDVLCDSMGVDLAAPEKQQVDKLESKMRKRGGEWLLEKLCARHTGGVRPGEIVRECLDREWNALAHIEDADFRAKTVKSVQWAFRWTLPSIRMYQPGALPRLPFLDPSIIDFFCTVPTKMVEGRRLQIEYLKRFAPHLARVRWQAYDADLFHYQHFGTWQLPRRAWKAALRVLSRRKRIRRNWEIQLHDISQRGRLIEILCAEGLFLGEVDDSAATGALLTEFVERPDAANGYIISMLVTFSAWARSFHSGAGGRGTN